MPNHIHIHTCEDCGVNCPHELGLDEVCKWRAPWLCSSCEELERKTWASLENAKKEEGS